MSDSRRVAGGDSVDVIVVGSGAAGLSAACTAAALGSKVLVLEHSDRVGGTTAISGGMVWIPNNHKMATAGLQDSAEAAREYLRSTVPDSGNDPRMEAFLVRGDEAVRFLEQNTCVRLQPVRRYPDYYPEMPGSTAGGRVLEPVPVDGQDLGADFALLRDPLPEFMLFGGMMVSREDLPVFRRATRSPRAAWHVLKLVARYGAQRLRAHRGTSLVLGNALAARLLQSARQLGVEIELNATVREVQMRDGRAVGVRVGTGPGEREVRARSAVILATGGISHHDDLRRDYVPARAGSLSATVRSGAGQGGVHLARSVGARLSPPSTTLGEARAFWVPVSIFRRSDGSEAMFPHTVTDRAKPGLIAVDRDGKRFANEAISYHEFVRAQLSEPALRSPAWLICDSRFLWKYGLGRVRPFATSTREERSSGYLKRANTIEALASAIGVPAASFMETVRSYNEAATLGQDPAFGRGSNIYQRHLGDAEHLPNPCVAPIGKGPFFAVAVVPADLGMAAGIMTDENARVLGADGQPIPGLYACGNDMDSIMHGAYPGPGITLGPALVFGYLAAKDAAGRG